MFCQRLGSCRPFDQASLAKDRSVRALAAPQAASQMPIMTLCDLSLVLSWYDNVFLVNFWVLPMRQFFSALKRRRAPQLPEGVRVYAVGDVHGRADLLAQLLSQIDSHLGQNPVSRPIEVFLGDYVDRGPNSRDVIDLLIGRRNSHETIFLKGNHEKYILDFLRDPKIWDVWSQYGGFE